MCRAVIVNHGGLPFAMLRCAERPSNCEAVVDQLASFRAPHMPGNVSGCGTCPSNTREHNRLSSKTVEQLDAHLLHFPGGFLVLDGVPVMDGLQRDGIVGDNT